MTWCRESCRPDLAPVVEGYVTVGDREMQLIGVDPLAELRSWGYRGGLQGGRGRREGEGGGGPAGKVLGLTGMQIRRSASRLSGEVVH